LEARGDTQLHPGKGRFLLLPDGSEIPVGRVQLLPDTCIVKVPEREWWCPEVQGMTKADLRVYALIGDSTSTFARCAPPMSFGSSKASTKRPMRWPTTKNKREELNELILEGDRDTEPVSYFHLKGNRADVRAWPPVPSRPVAEGRSRVDTVCVASGLSPGTG